MMQEFWTWLTTPCAPQARRLGYLYEAIAMQARLGRCVSAWQSHLKQSQVFIEQCLQQQPKGGVCVVFGSGLGIDLPHDTLLAHFDELWLVDMVHLRSAQQSWIKDRKKVKFIQRDVTETLGAVSRGELSVAEPKQWLDRQDITFVISANILGQLPLQPITWLEKRYPLMEEEKVYGWSQQIIRAHIRYLQAFQQNGARVCLIADLEWHHAHENQVRSVTDAWRGVAHEKPTATWEWRIAPRGELRGNRTQTNWVGGWCWDTKKEEGS